MPPRPKLASLHWLGHLLANLRKCIQQTLAEKFVRPESVIQFSKRAQPKRSLPHAQNTATEPVINQLNYDYPTITLPFMHMPLFWSLPCKVLPTVFIICHFSPRLDHTILFQLITVLIFGVKYALRSREARNFLHHPVTHRPLAPNILFSIQSATS